MIVRFYSEKIRQEITAIVERLEDFVADGVNAVSRLAGVETRSSADSALQRWMDTYGVEFERSTDGQTDTLRIDAVLSALKSHPFPQLREVLREGLDAWRRAGRDPATFARCRFEAREVHGRDDFGEVGNEITW